MNSRIRSHWEHMGLEVKTSLSQVCLLLPAPCKLEVVILKICLLQFFKSLSNFKVITPYSHKSGSVSSQPCFPAVPTVFDCVRLFQQMIFKCGASFQGLRVPACCSSFSSMGHSHCWLCTVGSCPFRLPRGLQETAGDRLPFSSLWGPLTTVAHFFDVKTIGCSAFCSERIRNRH